MRLSRVAAPVLVALSLFVPMGAQAGEQHRGAGPIGNLAVSGGAQAAQRTVTWTEPTTSDLPIVAYNIVVKKGNQVLVTGSAQLHVTTFVLKRKDLKPGTDKVSVVAVTKDGAGPKVTVKFPVKKPTHH